MLTKMVKVVMWMLFGSPKRKRVPTSGNRAPFDSVRFGPLEAALWLNESRGGRRYFTFSITRQYGSNGRAKSLRPEDVVALIGLAVKIALWCVSDGRQLVRHDVRKALENLVGTIGRYRFVQDEVQDDSNRLQKALKKDLKEDNALHQLLARHTAKQAGKRSNGVTTGAS